MSVLVIYDILGFLAKTLTANDKYSLRNRKKLLQQIQMQLSKKKKFSPNSWLDILNLHQLLSLLEKKITRIRYVFLELGTAKDVISEVSTKLRFKTSFNSQHAKQCDELHHSTFIISFHHFGGNCVGKCRP